jgi:hypothetical protein
LGRSQAVRQRILIPPFGGSIPPAPASHFAVRAISSQAVGRFPHIEGGTWSQPSPFDERDSKSVSWIASTLRQMQLSLLDTSPAHMSVCDFRRSEKVSNEMKKILRAHDIAS